MKDLSKNVAHYTPLMGIFIFTLIGFWFFSYNRQFQFSIAAATSISYVVWGLVHHKIHKDLNLSVLMEYVMIAIIGFIILSFMILRA